MKSLHLIASPEMGGAERWFVRFLHAMIAAGESVEAVVRKGSQLHQLHLDGIPFHAAGFHTVWDPWSKYEVNRIILNSKADIVQTYMGRATRLSHIQPKKGQVHVARLGGYYKLRSFKHAHAWIGNTKALCDWMVKGGLPKEKVHYISNFAQPVEPVSREDIDRLKSKTGISPNDWVVLTAGRFVEFKGHRYLLEALVHLPKEINGRKVVYVLIGDGPLKEQLHAYAKQLGVQDRILWVGWVHRPAIWFHLADLVVFPSREGETLGNVILESWAYQKPLVTTAFRGAKEIASHGIDSWIVPCDQGKAIATGIKQVLSDDELRGKLVINGLKKVADEFSERRIIDEYKNLYQSLMD